MVGLGPKASVNTLLVTVQAAVARGKRHHAGGDGGVRTSGGGGGEAVLRGMGPRIVPRLLLSDARPVGALSKPPMPW
jgi:hypothetical protein